MLSAIFRGNSMIFTTTGISMLMGGTAGALFMYSFQNEATDIEYWNDLWSKYRSKYTDIKSSQMPYWARQDSILNGNDNKYLKLLTPSLPKLLSPAQIKSIRIFVPLCGASDDLEIINDFVTKKIETETQTIEQAKQYKLKIIGVDSSKDAIQFFMDKMDISEKYNDNDDLAEIDYQNEYNFKDNQFLYQIEDDVFSKIEIYKHKNYNLINCDIFDASMPRLILRADAIYDNQSFSIINPKRRSQYINLLKNITSNKCKILLVTERFDEYVNDKDKDDDNDIEIPFYSINSKDELFKEYKKLCNMEPKNIKLLDSIPWNEDRLKTFGLKEASSDVWLIDCK